MAQLQVSLSVDAQQLVSDLRLLAESVQRSAQVLERFLGLGDLALGLCRVDADLVPAGTADQVEFRLELPQGHADLVRAVRAGDFDAL